MSSPYKAVGAITAIFLAFAFVHSIFVTPPVKNLYKNIFGETFVKAFYRLIYTFFGMLTTIAAFYLISIVPDVTIYALPEWLHWPMHAMQLLGVYIGVRAFGIFNFWEFIGARQAWRYITKRDVEGDIEGIRINRLVTTGIYGMVRNPMYLAGIMIFTFNPYWTRTWITVSVLADAYFVFGAFMEQKRLIKHFGDEYKQYMEEVPLLLPRPRGLKYLFW